MLKTEIAFLQKTNKQTKIVFVYNLKSLFLQCGEMLKTLFSAIQVKGRGSNNFHFCTKTSNFKQHTV